MLILSKKKKSSYFNIKIDCRAKSTIRDTKVVS